MTESAMHEEVSRRSWSNASSNEDRELLTAARRYFWHSVDHARSWCTLHDVHGTTLPDLDQEMMLAIYDAIRRAGERRRFADGSPDDFIALSALHLLLNDDELSTLAESRDAVERLKRAGEKLVATDPRRQSARNRARGTERSIAAEPPSAKPLSRSQPAWLQESNRTLDVATLQALLRSKPTT